jgi:hypothetical protein
VYWLLKPGKVKQEIRLVVLAGNRLLLIAGILFCIQWCAALYTEWISMIEYEQFAIVNRMRGPYWWAYCSMLVFSLSPQLFWFRKIRNSVLAALLMPLLVNWGIIVERLIIMITSLHRDYLPSSWMMFHPLQIQLMPMLIYLVMLGAVYVFIKKRGIRKTNMPT